MQAIFLEKLATLPVLFAILIGIILAVLLAAALRRHRKKAVFLLFGNGICLILFLGLIEAGGQIYAYFHPSYTVYFLQPDRNLGWKHFSNLSWLSTDESGWYSKEFTVPIKSNSRGFRDLERTQKKSENLKRVALLGDSFVEAVQVPFDETAGAILEKRLNASAQEGVRYEVLNFGVSNYGVSQFYLSWHYEGAFYRPDYVFVMISAFHMVRTVSLTDFDLTHRQELSVRPAVERVNGKLVYRPVRDYEAFQSALNRALANMDENHSQRRRGIFVKQLFERLAVVIDKFWTQPLMGLQNRWSGILAAGDPPPPMGGGIEAADLDLNLQILKDLHREIRARGAELILADVSNYFEKDGGALELLLREFSAREGIGYFSLSPLLFKAESEGRRVLFARDGHFNQEGNRIFAEGMHGWFQKNAV